MKIPRPAISFLPRSNAMLLNRSLLRDCLFREGDSVWIRIAAFRGGKFSAMVSLEDLSRFSSEREIEDPPQYVSCVGPRALYKPSKQSESLCARCSGLYPMVANMYFRSKVVSPGRGVPGLVVADKQSGLR